MEKIWDSFVSFMSTSVVPVVTSAVIRLVIAAACLMIGWKLINFFIKKLQSGHVFLKMDAGANSFLGSLLSITLKVLLIITIAAYLGVPMASMVAALGSAGLAIGLALQGSLGNLAGGLMLLIFKQFKVGDYIATPDAEGTVTEISILYTTLTTTDNRRVTIPNGTLANGVVVNNSAMPTRRVDLLFSASYKHDAAQVKEVILSVATACERLETDPAPTVFLSAYAANSVDYTLRYWVKREDYWSSQNEIKEAMQEAFAKAEIEIPYPQMDLHIEQKIEQK